MFYVLLSAVGFNCFYFFCNLSRKNYVSDYMIIIMMRCCCCAVCAVCGVCGVRGGVRFRVLQLGLCLGVRMVEEELNKCFFFFRWSFYPLESSVYFPRTFGFEETLFLDTR